MPYKGHSKHGNAQHHMCFMLSSSLSRPLLVSLVFVMASVTIIITIDHVCAIVVDCVYYGSHLEFEMTDDIPQKNMANIGMPSSTMPPPP